MSKTTIIMTYDRQYMVADDTCAQKKRGEGKYDKSEMATNNIFRSTWMPINMWFSVTVTFFRLLALFPFPKLNVERIFKGTIEFFPGALVYLISKTFNCKSELKKLVAFCLCRKLNCWYLVRSMDLGVYCAYFVDIIHPESVVQPNTK